MLKILSAELVQLSTCHVLCDPLVICKQKILFRREVGREFDCKSLQRRCFAYVFFKTELFSDSVCLFVYQFQSQDLRSMNYGFEVIFGSLVCVW